MDAKEGAFKALDAVRQPRVLRNLSASQAGAEADLKTLEAKLSDKVEVTARSIARRGACLQSALDEIADGGSAFPC